MSTVWEKLIALWLDILPNFSNKIRTPISTAYLKNMPKAQTLSLTLFIPNEKLSKVTKFDGEKEIRNSSYNSIAWALSTARNEKRDLFNSNKLWHMNCRFVQCSHWVCRIDKLVEYSKLFYRFESFIVSWNLLQTYISTVTGSTSWKLGR